jgi:DNA invertase Pin-like site-specific DNA recombinase
MEKILGYARTSTSKQEIENQLIALKEIGVQPENIYFDDGVSGSSNAKNRKQFKKVFEMIQNKEVSTLYVFELSRIGRSAGDTIRLFIEIEQYGTQIISLNPQESWTKFSNNSMNGIRNIFISMFAWFAEIEKNCLSERTKLGLDRARKEGKVIGRPEKEPDKKEVLKLHGNGLKPAQIARAMKIPYTTLYRWMQKWDDEERIKRNREA